MTAGHPGAVFDELSIGRMLLIFDSLDTCSSLSPSRAGFVHVHVYLSIVCIHDARADEHESAHRLDPIVSISIDGWICNEGLF